MAARAELRARAVDALVDSGRVPDPLLALAIRRLLRRRLAQLRAGGPLAARQRAQQVRRRLADGPVTVHADAANDQHYEVPAEFFAAMLGARLKYSGGLWPTPATTLDESEEAMLELTAQRAELVDGQDVLELGCGWGSLTLWMAERFPNSTITAVSNSASQRDHILRRAKQFELDNVDVLTLDVADLDLAHRSVDRVVSVEMFEHVRNHGQLFSRIADWLRDDGKAFVHVFAHRELPYLFETDAEAGRADGGGDWMSRHFFTGGVMPSLELLGASCDPLVLEQQWVIDGTHYARTCQGWLDRLDANRDVALAALATVHGDDAAAQLHRWRTFDLACRELFAFRGGGEWVVAHHRFAKA